MNNFTFTNIIDTDYYKNLANAVNRHKNHYIFWEVIFGLVYALIISPLLNYFAFHPYIIILSCILLIYSIWYFFQESKHYKEILKNNTVLLGVNITQIFDEDSFSVKCTDFNCTYSYKVIKGIYETDSSFCIILNRYDGIVVSKSSINTEQLDAFRSFITAKSNFGTIKIKKNSRRLKKGIAWVLIFSFIPIIYGTLSLRVLPQTFEDKYYTIVLDRTFSDEDFYYSSSFKGISVLVDSYSYNDIPKDSVTGEVVYKTFLEEVNKSFHRSTELHHVKYGKDGNNHFLSFETDYREYCYLYCVPAKDKVIVAEFQCHSEKNTYNIQKDFEKWAKSITAK